MRLGTRGSALALAQAQWVADRLDGETRAGRDHHPRRSRSGSPGDKSRWVSELEHALLDGRIDLAVHSAKDVPSELADGLELVAIPAREDARDALCGGPSVAALAPGARVGTSSVRRAAQLRAARDDIEVVPLRGNVDTRLRKLAEGQVDALVLALAGLERLGRAAQAGGVIDAFVPAAGQGALALEARAGELDPAALTAVIDDAAMAVRRRRARPGGRAGGVLPHAGRGPRPPPRRRPPGAGRLGGPARRVGLVARRGDRQRRRGRRAVRAADAGRRRA